MLGVYAFAAATSLRDEEAPPSRARLESRAMIDSDQVLHVAKLARLRLSDEEVDRMAGELSKILEHVETMNELDLDGVEPTSHVVDLTNVLREDVPRPSLPREVALEQAPDATESGFRVPSPGSVVSDELLPLTAAEQARRIEAGEVSAAEVFEYWRGRAAADDLGAYLWVADEAPDDAGSFPPIAVKDLFCVRGVPSMAGSRILEGYRPPTPRRASRTSRTPASRCSARRTRTSSPWGRRTRTPASARSRTRGTARASRVARPAAAPRPWRRARRRGRSAPTPAARSASRRACAGSWE